MILVMRVSWARGIPQKDCVPNRQFVTPGRDGEERNNAPPTTVASSWQVSATGLIGLKAGMKPCSTLCTDHERVIRLHGSNEASNNNETNNNEAEKA